MYEYRQFILNKKHSIIFEIIELTVLVSIVTFFFHVDEKILAMIYIIPIIEHIRQVIYYCRQYGGSLEDYITFFYFLLVMLYSISISNKLSIIASTIGVIIHIITITTRTTFSQLVSHNDIKNFILN
tara:strand:+ start:110 stop:490 length:381 start_codon:yes stop_codon:yes gene_type:complete